MTPLRSRRTIGAFVVSATLLAACGSSSPTGPPRRISFGPPLPQRTTIPSGAPRCHMPARLPDPTWFPTDLPLPEGSYVSQSLTGDVGYHRTVFTVPGGLFALARFIANEWPTHGWILGRGDAEANEVENTFQRSPSIGAFKAQGQFCFPGYSLMLVAFAPDRSKLESHAGVGTQPGSPIPPSPSPSPSASG